MIRIQQECVRRGISRLCHFTQSRNLAHILGDSKGIVSRKTLEAGGMPHNPTDPDRYDGCDHLICCSVEYPNVYYFTKVRAKDLLFKDWVVLLINSHYIWQPGTKFCSCNAATENGAHIVGGYLGFHSMFDQRVRGVTFERSSKHLVCSPTNNQAEVLVPDPISLDDIIGIVVADDAQAKRESIRMKLQGLKISSPVYVAPDFYSNGLARIIQNGKRANERAY